MQKQSRNLTALFVCFFVISLTFISFEMNVHAQNNITTPDEFFGFKIGADKKLARWDKITEYF